jgi:hypothetical protein
MKIIVDKQDIVNAHLAIKRLQDHPLLQGLIIGDIVEEIATEADDLLLKILKENESPVVAPFVGDVTLLTSDAIKEGTCVFISTLTDTSRIRKMLIEQYQEKI